jgi:hypothetical protein
VQSPTALTCKMGCTMKQAEQTNIINLPSPIARLWKSYLAAAEVKQRVYARYDNADAGGDNDAIADAHAACDLAYDDLADISEAILQARPASLIDLAIQADVIARREADLGGPCDQEEIANFCRDVQIVAASVI